MGLNDALFRVTTRAKQIGLLSDRFRHHDELFSRRRQYEQAARGKDGLPGHCREHSRSRTEPAARGHPLGQSKQSDQGEHDQHIVVKGDGTSTHAR